MIRTIDPTDDNYVSILDVARAAAWSDHGKATELTLRRLRQRRTTRISSLTFIPKGLENDVRALHVGSAEVAVSFRSSSDSEPWSERWLVAYDLRREEALRLAQQLDQGVVVVESIPRSSDRILLVEHGGVTDVGDYSTELLTTTLAVTRGADDCSLVAQPGSVVGNIAVAAMRREVALVRRLLDR